MFCGYFFSTQIGYAQLGLSDIWLNYTYYAPPLQVIWVNDSIIVNIDEKISLQNVSTKQNTLINTTHLPDSMIIEDVVVQGNLLCFLANSSALYRYSTKSYLLVYDLKSNNWVYQSEKKYFNPSFSDDGSYLAYTDENNLFVTHLPTKKQQQLTTTGLWNNTINGRADWVQEEEFGASKAYQWITGTHQIAYLSYNESHVKSFSIQEWKQDLYPSYFTYKYPKAGERNAITSLFVHDLKQATEIAQTNNNWEYFTKLCVGPQAGQFYYIRLDRLQQKMNLVLVKNGAESTVYQEESLNYVELPSYLEVGKNGILLDSYRNGHKQFLLISDSINTLTPATTDVVDLTYYDWETQEIWFTSRYFNTYTQTFCYSKKQQCIPLSTSALSAQVSASPNGGYFLWNESSLKQAPKVYLQNRKTKAIINQLSNNENQTKQLAAAGLGLQSFIEVPINNTQFISCLQILPPNFDPKKKYPVLMHCYGGPGHKVVENKYDSFDYLFHQLIAQKGCIIVLADGRGTDGNGTNFRQASYGQLGNLEHQDQVAVANYFKSLPYVDESRVGIWGWSFGGYLASLCLLKSPDVFSCAIAVAPVSNWRLYDNVYTERYMGLPQSNGKAYDDNSPTTYAKNLKGKFLLIHGTADDNVHIQNSYLLQQALLKYNQQFETFYYPDKNHGIYGGTTRFNLYQKMLNFIETSLLNTPKSTVKKYKIKQ
jgi:dipeptidyl-peptidase 4